MCHHPLCGSEDRQVLLLSCLELSGHLRERHSDSQPAQTGLLKRSARVFPMHRAGVSQGNQQLCRVTLQPSQQLFRQRDEASVVELLLPNPYPQPMLTSRCLWLMA